ncbi:signal-induced proliferation-associated 1-like protein 2 isoform X1 [Onthophagus taurus]|uniref:signal-induced proliferation-associated 1-like protein 2 isoform X1 n=2 Tax=Onthophagus taurus TaxID=166361 RepID=UPI0039BDD010
MSKCGRTTKTKNVRFFCCCTSQNSECDCPLMRDGMIGLQECGPAPPRAPSNAGNHRTRERTAQGFEYYNNPIQKTRINAAPRASYNDRHHHHLGGSVPRKRDCAFSPELLYRSNSSLELLDHVNSYSLKREYGSHGSIDVIDRSQSGAGGDAFFEMLQVYQPPALGVVTDQRSPGPSEFLRIQNHTNGTDDGDGRNPPPSPKYRGRISKFLGHSGSVSSGSMKNIHPKQTMDDSVMSISTTSMMSSAESEEIAKRRAFTHYDCQSLTTSLTYSVRIRKNLSKRRNTTTGASAASTMKSVSDGQGGEEDSGDGQNNDLVQSCPFFRNETGGEEERIVSLTRLQGGGNRRPLHRPPLAYGVAVLEFAPGQTHWRHSTCPYQRLPRPIESVDQGALYYREYFKGQDHQNWFGMDEQLGPLAISIKRERIPQTDNTLMQYQYRLIIRTSELLTLRGAILEDAIPTIKSSGSSTSSKSMHSKEVLEYVAPEIQLSSLRLGMGGEQTEDQLIKVDEQGLTNHYKVGVMYCKSGQSSEEEMYNNEEAGKAFEEFLETIGTKVRLQGFNKYRAGLDSKSDSTGLYSVYSEYQDCQIMFHVSTMLPFTPNNRQQLLRKRHIGNDIVTIVFQEPGALPFTPKGIRSQFQHVFIVVRAINPCTENTHYSVAVSRSKDVQVFGPPIKDGAIFPKGKAFADFLLAKVVNAENAAHRSEKFVTMATRTRQEYLKDLVTNYSTSTPIDTGQKFSIFSSKKKEKIRPRFIPDACQRGALLWQVLLEDCGQSQQIECLLGISTDSLVLIEEQTKQIVFVTPCKSILGWSSSQTSCLRIYHHQGERMTIHIKDTSERDELVEIIDRLKAVTQGTTVQELQLQRNIMGQLGFHVQPDGTVTVVECQGQAWQAGLRQNSRLVEICKIAVSTLTHDQMVDLLKTSTYVTLTVIPPLPDGSVRKGCTLSQCKYTESNYEDYENVADDVKNRKTAQMQKAVPGNHRKIYDRSFSPPRSSNSSGYATASNEGTMTSSSSGHSNDDPWYDTYEDPLVSKRIHSNNTYPSTPKKNVWNSHIQMSQSHNHFPQQIQHNKVQASHSLPLQHINFQQPLTATIHNIGDIEVPYKLDKNNIIKQHNERLRITTNEDYGITRLPKMEYTHDINRNTDGHSTDSSISERLCGVGSEDELSNGSGQVSPRSRRKHISNISNSNSRNHSPRSMNSDAKLRPGVTARSSNRNSANLNNNFQEELLRLINPDNIEAPPEAKPITKDIKSHSRENLNATSLSVHKQPSPDVILTLARPATVISNASTTSSPLPTEFKSGGSGRMSPRLPSPSKTKAIVVGPEALPLPEDMDWPSLVDTATKVVGCSDENRIGDGERRNWEDDGPIDASISSNISSSASVPELQSHVRDLESRVSRETRRRLSLEDEVRRLREDNKKLQDQAQAALLQLRKFTEWFFKNVQRQ